MILVTFKKHLHYSKKKINVETFIVEFECKINVDYHYQTRVHPVTFTLLIRKGGNHRADIK